MKQVACLITFSTLSLKHIAQVLSYSLWLSQFIYIIFHISTLNMPSLTSRLKQTPTFESCMVKCES